MICGTEYSGWQSCPLCCTYSQIQWQLILWHRTTIPKILKIFIILRILRFFLAEFNLCLKENQNPLSLFIHLRALHLSVLYLYFYLYLLLHLQYSTPNGIISAPYSQDLSLSTLKGCEIWNINQINVFCSHLPLIPPSFRGLV